MLFGRKIWTALALALFVWLLPTQGFSFEEDPYAYKSLFGKVSFEYERRATDENQNQTTSHKFLQRYSLDLRGYAINRRLLIYDAGYNYTNSDYRSKSSRSNTGISNYFLRTTALPLSAIPLTLYASRRSSRSTSATESTTTEDKYGLRWLLYFRSLPKTTLSAERDHLESSDGGMSTTDTYRLDMEKAIGPTENYFSYNQINADTGGDNYSRYVINFTNATKVSKSTHFFFGATRSGGESAINQPATLTGVSLVLKSAPSKDFSQTHTYNHYNSERSDHTQTGNLYSGDMRYEFTKRLNASFSLDVNNTTSTSETFSSESVSQSTSMTVRYRLTSTTTLRQLVAYSKSESNSDDPAANLTDTETLRTLTSINYNKRLNWAMLGTSAGLGYTDEKSGSDTAGQAIEQNYSLTLSDIDLNRYIAAGTSADYSTRTTISGNDISHTRYAFNLDLYNKIWKRYVDANARYTRSATKTYISDFENRNEVYQLSADSTYFNNTNFNALARHSKTFEEITGTGKSTALSFGANHNRRLYKGLLALAYNFTTTRTDYEGNSDKINTTLYSLNYTRTLLDDMIWRFLAQRSSQEASNSFSNITTIKNSLVYPLRSWLFSGDHEYRITEYANSERTETILMLRASRIFIRMW